MTKPLQRGHADPGGMMVDGKFVTPQMVHDLLAELELARPIVSAALQWYDSGPNFVLRDVEPRLSRAVQNYRAKLSSRLGLDNVPNRGI